MNHLTLASSLAALALAAGVSTTRRPLAEVLRGGVKVDASARVRDTAGRAIEGLYGAGEVIGEIFYYNYPGATSVLRGAVFGRIAGREAARRAS